jgi:hypothetical protein
MIKLELTVEEVNGVLQSLGNMPYAQVVALVENIKAQAIPQVPQVPQVQAQATPEPVAE